MGRTRPVAALIVALSAISLFSACGNSNFFPSQTAIVLLTVAPPNNVVAAGSTVNFTATGTLGNNSTQDVSGSVTWTSSNTGVATINSSGLATGVANGVTTITASTNHLTVQATLLVADINGIQISPTSWSAISSGATQQFTAAGTGNDTASITNYVTWSSSDTTCATVTSTGLATFVGTAGASSCNITASIGNYSASASVGGSII
ncbi:MAG TPA: Ig-like domain-containing protein [Candidatus Koribacter sp.]|jgi:hypothetical protein